MIRRLNSRLPLSILVLATGCLRLFAQNSGLGSMNGSESVFSQGQGEPQIRTIQGTVVNSVTGEPIYRALVQIGGQSATLTDHEGHFEFEGVTETMLPWAMKPGYFADRRFQGFVPSLSPEAATAPIVVKLVPEAVLSGAVTGADGGPLEGIQVQLKMLSVQEGVRRWVQRQGTTTNSEGQYRFYDLEAGDYAVVTGFHTEGMQDAAPGVAYVPARYPPVAGTGAEAAIVLAPGDHREADLDPPVERVYPVTGTVAGYGESRGVSFRVETAAGEEISPNSRFMARTGEFRLMLPGGSYRVTATAYQRGGRQRQQLEARNEIIVPQAPVRGISFALEPAATIPVDVSVDSSDSPSQDTGQALQPPNPNIMLINTDPDAPAGFLPAQPVRGGLDGPGSSPAPSTIQDVPPGRYVLQVQAGSAWYVSAASCGGVDLLQEPLTIVGGAAGCSIRLVLRNSSGSVHVTLRDQEGASGQTGATARSASAVVYLLPLGDLSRQVAPMSMQGQEFTAAGVAPGRYLVLALDHSAELAYRDPDALRRYAALGEEITVAPNSAADAEVSLVTGEP